MQEIKFNCPECNQKLKVTSKATGSVLICPTCQKSIEVPFALTNVEQGTQFFKSSKNDISKATTSKYKKSLSARYFLGFAIVSFCWPIIYDYFFSSHGMYFLQNGVLPFLVNYFEKWTAFIIIVLGISSFFFVILKLFRFSPQFPIILFVVSLITGFVTIKGEILIQKDNAQILRYNGQMIPQRPKPTTGNTNQTYTVRKIGDLYYLESIIDNFAVFFPTEPYFNTGGLSGLTFRSYQSEETFENGLILYSVVFSVYKDGVQLVAYKNEAYNYLEMALEQYRKSLRNKSSLDGDSHRSIEFSNFPAIKYKFDFSREGIDFFNEGMFLATQNEIIRISMSYSKEYENQVKKKYYHFTNSFDLRSSK